MKISIIGTGYVGLVTGACLAEIGNQVMCLDVDPAKIALLEAGGMPIYEPGLKEIVARNRAEGRLRFTTEVAQSVAHGDIQFIAVGTPPDEDGSADLQYVLAAAREIGRLMSAPRIVVDKSTVPVGTADRVREAIASELAARGLSPSMFTVVSNPEFLKEGAAVEDFMRPDRIVVGTASDEAGLRARERMRQLYAPFNRNHERVLFMDVRSAELTKYAANAMLATRISFMNEIANLADRVGADVEEVRRGIGSDSRIGYSFLYAGTGYGGSCFPKDVQALSRTARQHGCEMQVLDAVERVNDSQKRVLPAKMLARLGADFTGMTIAVWGLAFKPNTDDMREAPSRVVIRELLARGATVRAHDPVANAEAARVLDADLADLPAARQRLSLHDTPMDVVQQADALVIMTEWKAFRSPDFAALRSAMRRPLVFDGRNMYEPRAMAEEGFEYFGIGRGIGRGIGGGVGGGIGRDQVARPAGAG